VEFTKKQLAGLKANRTLKRTAGRNKKTQALKYKAFLGYSKKIKHKKIPTCFCCGENSSLDFLTMDHKQGKKQMLKNKKLRKLGYSHKRTGKSLNNWLIANNFPDGFQILCWNCNVTKFLYGKCPHRRGPRIGSKKELSLRAKKAARKRKHNLAAKKAAATRIRNKKRKERLKRKKK